MREYPVQQGSSAACSRPVELLAVLLELRLPSSGASRSSLPSRGVGQVELKLLHQAALAVGLITLEMNQRFARKKRESQMLEEDICVFAPDKIRNVRLWRDTGRFF